MRRVRVTRKITIIGIAVFLLMQLYQPARNIDGGKPLPSHITNLYKVPEDVRSIFAASCYDCHSNNTRYPWYAYLQPARLFMDNHIKNGKKELNFSEFGNYSKRRQGSKLESISKQVKSGEMPLFSYTLLHKNSKLTSLQKKAIIDWVNTILEENQ
ncbi:MAG: heme-binding domain-containing protein [Chitinophagaceae bacterium]